MYGITGQAAPELNVKYWIDEFGNETKPKTLESLGSGYKILYCFQSWCPGCHSSGFPTLKKIMEGLNGYPIGYAVIQTVFEGFEENGIEKLVETQKKYGLQIPFGHDLNGPKNSSGLMARYRTGGTPWFILISPDNRVIFNDFRISPEKTIQALKDLMDEKYQAPKQDALSEE